MLKYYTSQQIIRISLGSQALIGIVLVTGTYFQVLGLYGTISCIFLYLSCQGFTFPNTSALSMAPFGRNAGTASALMGTIQMGIGAGSSAMVSYLINHTAMPMTSMMCGCVLASLSVLLIGGRIIRYKARIADVKDETVEMISNS
jgi:MFS transporter, DHA1 family, multidrug resistance protein